jgi:hypothetical protein
VIGAAEEGVVRVLDADHAVAVAQGADARVLGQIGATKGLFLEGLQNTPISDVRRVFARSVTSGVIDAESLREGPRRELANGSADADRNSPYASELRDVCAAASPWVFIA